MFWTESLGRIELQLTKAQARKGFHQGQCDDDIAELRRIPAIRRQLDKLSPPLVAECLRDCGAWNELSNHDENLSLLLWIACSDIVEGVN
jgi:hypothetical protein